MAVAFCGKTPNYDKVYGNYVKAEKKAMKKFAPNIRRTKEGNLYYKSNAWKKLGAGLTAGAAVVGAAAMAVITKNPKAALAILAPALPGVAGAFVGGAIIDGVQNKERRKEADQMAKVTFPRYM